MNELLQDKVAGFLKESYESQLFEPVDIFCEYAASSRPFASCKDLPYRKIRPEEQWGKAWEKGWFHFSGRIPEHALGSAWVIEIDASAEGLLYDSSGKALGSVSCNSIFLENYSREFIHFVPEKNGRIDLWLEVTASHINGTELEFHLESGAQNYGRHEAVLKKLRAGKWNETLFLFRHRIALLADWLGTEKTADASKTQAESWIEEAFKILETDGGNPKNALSFLDQNIKNCCDAGTARLSCRAIGHAHIDLAYLWTEAEGIRKAARTFANQLELLERYPAYCFGASQAWLYRNLKRHYRKIYERIKPFVHTGRWELLGGMWVEADCCLPCGESLIRQILLGKNFFRREFGFEVNNIWLPDAFGYSAILPQIIRKCGCDFFLSQKLSWNDTNEFPYSTFVWRGIDSSEVTAHFPPENNYASMLTPSSLCAASKRFSAKNQEGEFLSLFGVGDGGGGPSDAHLENGLTLSGLPSAPAVAFGRADNFFTHIKSLNLPVWEGELYLEKHRGALTSQSFLKRENRKWEYRLFQLELVFSSFPSGKYPARSLNLMWKRILKNQFHDILPGSSIPQVYNNVRADFQNAAKKAEELLDSLARRELNRRKNSMLVCNTASVPFRRCISLPPGWSACKEFPGRRLSREVAEILVDLPPLSGIVLHRAAEKQQRAIVKKNLVMENESVRYEFNSDAVIVNAFDKRRKRNILSGPGNLLSLYADTPAQYDAWDLAPDYPSKFLEHAHGVKYIRHPSSHVGEVIDFRLTVGKSHLNLRVRLNTGSPLLEFECLSDWHEEHRMLRVSFAAKVKTEEAVTDLHCGFLRRRTKWSTSFEQARYEVLAHRYADLSENGFGVALLNDCKYGHRLQGSVLDLNLLRAPKYPDSSADIGKHCFHYALLPHSGNLAEVASAAESFNHEPLIFPGFSGDFRPVCRIAKYSGVLICAVKKAEHGNALIIRLAEELGRAVRVRLEWDSIPSQIWECDMLERKCIRKYLPARDVILEFRPFEIKTLKYFRRTF